MLVKNTRILLSVQIIWAVIVIAFYLLYKIGCFNIEISIDIAKYFILISLFLIFFSFYLLKLGLLHIYSVFIYTVFMYNISYVILSFWLGNEILSYTYDFGTFLIFDSVVVVEYLNVILLFLIFIHLGALFAFSINEKQKFVDEWSYNGKMELYGLFLFYLFLLPTLFYYYTFLKQIFLAGGYLYKFGLSGTTDMNVLIRVSDDLLKLAFFLLLASKSKFSRLIVPTLIYLAIQFATSFISGSRVFFITQALFILVYISMRIKIKTTTILLVVLSFILYSIFIDNLRTTDGYDVNTAIHNSNEQIENKIFDLFLGQGSSMHILSLTLSLVEKDELEPSLRYFFDPLLGETGYIEGKPEKDYFFLADRLSAVFIARDFSAGAGLGSSIIAEFYVYGGVISVAIFSMLYGFVICRSDVYKYKSSEVLFFFLLMLPGLFYVCRAHPLYPILSLFKIFIFYLVLIKSRIIDKVCHLFIPRKFVGY